VSTSIEDVVALARNAFQRACDRSEPDRRGWMLEFGRRIGELGRLRAGDHPAVRALIAETAPGLDGLPLPWWVRALARAAEPVSTEDAEYQYALDLRSNVEFWKDFYRELAPDAVEQVEIEDIDEMLERLSQNYYVAEVPADIPASHVWWHRHDHDRDATYRPDTSSDPSTGA